MPVMDQVSWGYYLFKVLARLYNNYFKCVVELSQEDKGSFPKVIKLRLTKKHTDDLLRISALKSPTGLSPENWVLMAIEGKRQIHESVYGWELEMRLLQYSRGCFRQTEKQDH